MGHRNLDLYYRYWADHPDLGHVAQRILAYICFRCSDDATPPVYFEGLEALIVASGMTRGSSSVATLKRNAQRALKQLKDSGAIVSSGQAGPGVRENYALTLDGSKTALPEGKGRAVSWRIVDRQLPPNGRSELPPNGRSELPPNGRSELPGMDVQESPDRAVGMNAPKKDLKNSNRAGIPKSSKATRLRVVTDPEEIEEDPPLTQEQERNRQTAALLQLMKQEAKTEALPDW